MQNDLTMKDQETDSVHDAAVPLFEDYVRELNKPCRIYQLDGFKDHRGRMKYTSNHTNHLWIILLAHHSVHWRNIQT